MNQEWGVIADKKRKKQMQPELEALVRRPLIRRLNAGDSARIKCQRGRYGDPDCTAQTTTCETVDWNTGNTQGTSFFYFCDDCNERQQEEK